MADSQSIPFRGIYAIRHVASGRIYIGSSVDIQSRWATHRSSLTLKQHHSRHLQRAWHKYGSDAFVFEVLEAVPCEADLVRVEQEYLDHFQPWKPENGYNTSPTAASCLGVKDTAETRAKMSAARKGRTLSPEHVAKVAAALRGKKRPSEVIAKMVAATKGRELSPEHKAKLSAALKGRKRSPEALANIRASNRDPQVIAKRVAAATGKKRGTYAAEHCARISAAHKGRKRGPQSPKHRAKLSEAMKRRKLTQAQLDALAEANRVRSAERQARQEQARAALRERFGGPPCPWVQDEPATKQLSMFDD